MRYKIENCEFMERLRMVLIARLNITWLEIQGSEGQEKHLFLRALSSKGKD
jgi:hypothetical protein